MTTILAIDPGLTTGWAVLASDGGVFAGSVSLDRWPHRVKGNRVGGRLNNLAHLVESLATEHGASIVACEHPPVVGEIDKGRKGPGFGARTASTLHQYHGEVARVADALGLPFDGDIYPATAKKAAMGKGRHSNGVDTKDEKAAEIRAGLERRGISIDHLTLDHNAVDALAVAVAAEERSA